MSLDDDHPVEIFGRLPELPTPEEFEKLTADQQRYIMRNLRISRLAGDGDRDE